MDLEASNNVVQMLALPITSSVMLGLSLGPIISICRVVFEIMYIKCLAHCRCSLNCPCIIHNILHKIEGTGHSSRKKTQGD